MIHVHGIRAPCCVLPWLVVPSRVCPSHFSPSVPAALVESSLCSVSTAAPADLLSCGWRIPVAVWMSYPLLAVSSDRPTSSIVKST